MKDDIQSTLNISLNGYIKKLVIASELLEKISKPLDALLDKPVDDNHPHYVCGDALEEIKTVIDDTALQLKYTKDIVMAKVGAWQQFPDNDEARRGYVYGYMDKKEDE